MFIAPAVVVVAHRVLGEHGSEAAAAAAGFGVSYLTHLVDHLATYHLFRHAQHTENAVERARTDEPPPMSPEDERSLKNLAKCAPTQWLAAATTLPQSRVLNEENVLSTILAMAGSPASDDDRRAFEASLPGEGEWAALLAGMAARCEHSQLAPDSTALLAAASYCRQEYASQLYRDLKHAPHIDPPAAEAMRWKATALVAALTERAAEEATSTRAEVKALREELLRLAGSGLLRAEAGCEKLGRKDGSSQSLKKALVHVRDDVEKGFESIGLKFDDFAVEVLARIAVADARANIRHNEIVTITRTTGELGRRWNVRTTAASAIVVVMLIVAAITVTHWIEAARAVRDRAEDEKRHEIERTEEAKRYDQARAESALRAAELKAQLDEVFALSKGHQSDELASSTQFSLAALALAEQAVKSKDALTRARGRIIRREFALADVALDEAVIGPINPFELLTVEGDRFYFDDRPDDAIPWYKAALLIQPKSREGRSNLATALMFARQLPIDPQRREATMILRVLLKELPVGSLDWAKTQYKLGNALSFMTSGDLEQNYRAAIGCYLAALEVQTQSDAPDEWAMTQHSMGSTLLFSTTGDLEQNRQEAIACFFAALQVRTRTAKPREWAMTQNNLGLAYSDLTTGSVEQNRLKGVACLRLALEVISRETDPRIWANIQNNLGAALRSLSGGNLEENRCDAIACHRLALEGRPRATNPNGWANTQVNLGNAFCALTSGDVEQNHREAIALYRLALEVFTRADNARRWADTQVCLGIALGELTCGDVEQNCHDAITCYRAALEVYTRKDNPRNWASIQECLGIVFSSLTSGDREQNLRDAITCFRVALEVFTKDSDASRWSETQTALGNAYWDLSGGDREEHLREAIVCYRAALEVQTRETQPNRWAATQTILGYALRSLTSGDREQDLHDAINCYRLALQVYTRDADPKQYGILKEYIEQARAAIDQLYMMK
jgi:tetratricopeptide (TPR) repeat protein